MTTFKVVSCLVKKKPSLLNRQERKNGYTPLHEALKAGNLELAIWMLKNDTTRELINTTDNDGMRAIDLLAFRVDDDHKKFIKESPLFENNYKVKKVFQAYSWGRAEDFQLGYPVLKDEQMTPREI